MFEGTGEDIFQELVFKEVDTHVADVNLGMSAQDHSGEEQAGAATVVWCVGQSHKNRSKS